MNYYFISYAWEHKDVQGWQFESSLIDISPFEWLKQTFEYKEIYKLISYQKISKEEYEKYKNYLD